MTKLHGVVRHGQRGCPRGSFVCAQWSSAATRRFANNIATTPARERNITARTARKCGMSPFSVPIFREENAPMLEAVQTSMGDADRFREFEPVMLHTDSGALRARRELDKLLAAEAK